MMRGSNAIKIQQWIERFGRFQNTDQTVAEFCQVEGVSSPSFYRWKKKLSPQVQPPGKVKRIRPSFQQVELLPSNHSTTIRLPNGIKIELGNDRHVVGWVLTQLLELPNASEGSRSC